MIIGQSHASGIASATGLYRSRVESGIQRESHMMSWCGRNRTPIPIEHPYLNMARPHSAISKLNESIDLRQVDLCHNDLILSCRGRMPEVMAANSRVEQAVLCSKMVLPVCCMLFNDFAYHGFTVITP